MQGTLLLTLLVAAFHLNTSVYCQNPSSTQIQNPTNLKIIEQTLNVNGKNATIYSIAQSDGTWGIRAQNGQNFNVRLENNLNVPSSLHWHGLILPSDQDGVAFITQYPIYPKESYHYHFPLVQEGTFWMHSHFGLQEQKQLSAPLIIHGAEDSKIADQEVILFLNDFSFKSPTAIFEELRSNCIKKMAMSEKKRDNDLFDVDYDAFLTNLRTLENPEVVEVKPNKRIRLRIINGSSGTNFLVSLGALLGEAIAVDGNRIKPLSGSTFELAVAQRIDILVKIPENGGGFPILAQGEGTALQTGLILATKGAVIPRIESKLQYKAGRLTNAQEEKLQALTPLPPKPVDQKVNVELGGDMAKYVWTLNGQAWPEVTPIVINKGKRIEISFKNVSMMSHPMHLHGHVFQVTSINGKSINGAMRDTILVMPNSTVKIQFDADNAGVWPLHCHLLYHLEAGMLTVVRYKDYVQPLITSE